MDVELIPKFLADPFWNSSRSDRITPTSTVSDNLVDVDDSKIRFCLSLFEIPVLRGVDIAQIAAGSRTSFARTRNGRVLGWGANEYGFASPLLLFLLLIWEFDLQAGEFREQYGFGHYHCTHRSRSLAYGSKYNA